MRAPLARSATNTGPVRIACMLVGLLLCAAWVPVPAIHGEAGLTGLQLLRLCSAGSAPDGDEAACHAYFDHVLTAFDGWARRSPALHYCLPEGFGVPRLVELYKLESRRYPHVLHVSAERLIAGMVLKFYPCRAI